MSESWDDYAEGWDDNPDVVTYAKLAFQTLQEVVDLKGLEVFDFGCGTGRLTEQIAPLALKVVSLDTSEKMVGVLRKKPLANVTALCGSLADLGPSSEQAFQATFDLVVASSVCAFVEDYEATLVGLKSLLKTSGLLVQWDWYSAGQASDPGFTNTELQETLTKVGFHAVRVSSGFAMDSPDGEATVLMAIAQV